MTSTPIKLGSPEEKAFRRSNAECEVEIDFEIQREGFRVRLFAQFLVSQNTSDFFVCFSIIRYP